MHTQLHTILQDLALAGITDVTTENPFDWSTSLTPARAAPRPIVAPTSAPQPVPAQPLPKPQAAPAPVPTKLDPKQYLRTHGATGAPLTIVTASLKHQTEGLPFNLEEKTLLTNILRALNLSIEDINLATVTATTDEDEPLATQQIQSLHAAAIQQLTDLEPQKILTLGQLASSVFIVGGHTPLAALRTKQPQPQKMKNTPTVTTYHPRHLLKTPLLKQRTWQDIQPLLPHNNKKEA